MDFDLGSVPFSRFGSYMAVSLSQGSLVLRSVHGIQPYSGVGSAVYRLEAVDPVTGESLPMEVAANPTLLTVSCGERGRIDCCFADADTLMFRGNGVGLRLVYVHGPYADIHPRAQGAWELNSATAGVQYLTMPLSGGMDVGSRISSHGYGTEEGITVTFTPDPSTGGFEAALEEFTGVWAPKGTHPGFDDALRGVVDEYRTWLEAMPSVPEVFVEARELAAYVNWSCVVKPKGHFKRHSMLMSKNWMNNVWTWDHCFNAMALAYGMPDLAWDQFMLPFDLQDQVTGALPDCFSDRWVLWNFCKPPIHGWTLDRMMDINPAFTDPERLREVYGPLCKATECWFRYRDDDHDGMPQYNHGNDSGWDNSTMFRSGVPIEGADLGAFLVIQMGVLGRVADILELREEAEVWRARASRLMDITIQHCWTGRRFTAPKSGTHSRVESDSLVALVPLVLGERLEKSVFDLLVGDLLEPGAFLTEWGLATERLQSPLYTPDGYWRGPIWAPSTHLIVDGLRQSGRDREAVDIVGRFARLCSRSGFAENFDAVTGEGLRDRAYTWTSSAFLVMAHEYLMQG